MMAHAMLTTGTASLRFTLAFASVDIQYLHNILIKKQMNDAKRIVLSVSCSLCINGTLANEFRYKK